MKKIAILSEDISNVNKENLGSSMFCGVKPRHSRAKFLRFCIAKTNFRSYESKPILAEMLAPLSKPRRGYEDQKKEVNLGSNFLLRRSPGFLRFCCAKPTLTTAKANLGSNVSGFSKQLFFNQIFDKKRLKALISWVFKQSGEAEALRIIDLLKETGFRHATKAGISIGLHDLATPIQKAVLISESQLAIATTERDFRGAKITATERSQRIIDTWHRASESLSKQVVDYFAIYDRFNPVYIMALSGARGNFSQVRQLIGMRGLMADQQGKIVNFPIQSNLREGLTLTEYFISCSGARKGLVDTALRTADTGYLTRRLVDVSHHVVVKKFRCNTNRSLAFSSLQSYNKVLLPLKERLVGRVLSEDIFISEDLSLPPFYEVKSPFFLRKQGFNKNLACKDFAALPKAKGISKSPKGRIQSYDVPSALYPLPRRGIKSQICKGASNFKFVKEQGLVKGHIVKSEAALQGVPLDAPKGQRGKGHVSARSALLAKQNLDKGRTAIAKQDQEISFKLALKIAKVREKVYLRSPLTCGFTHSVCQLCYGWSISQGSLVSLGDAVGVIAAQSIGEPGTQLTMRTFHTGGVFSGDLLQEIRAPHAGKIAFSKAFGGLLIRTTHGHLAFLSKSEGSLYITHDEPRTSLSKPFSFQSPSGKEGDGKEEGRQLLQTSSRRTVISIPAFSLLFIRQGETVTNNQLLAEFSIRTKEGAQPIKTQQTIFAELSGIIVEDCSGRVYTKKVKESALLLDSLDFQGSSVQSTYEPSFSNQSTFFPQKGSPSFTNHRCNKTKNLSKVWSTLEKGAKITVKSSSCKPKLCTTGVKPVGSSMCKAQIHTNEDLELENDLFSYVEPVQSGRLGFLKILSTRIGATLDYSYPTKSIDYNLKKKNKIHNFKKDRYYTNLDFASSKLFHLYLLPQITALLCFTLHRRCIPLLTNTNLLANTSTNTNLLATTNLRFVRSFALDAPLQISLQSEALHLMPPYKSSICKGKGHRAQSFVSGAWKCTANLDSNFSLRVTKLCFVTPDFSNPIKKKRLQFSLSKIESKYLHPESRKENRFLLQTIAEYGDIVDETYKKK